MSSVESQAATIIQYIVTPAEKEQAAEDVKNSSGAMWRSARLSRRLQAETDGDPREMSVTACRQAVAHLYDCHYETIRRREKAARLVDEHGIDPEDYDLLTFSYWRTAADANHLETPVESMMDIVAQIYQHTEIYGQRPSVDTVQGWVSGTGGGLPWRDRLESVADKLEQVAIDTLAEPNGRSLSNYCRVLIVDYLETGRSFEKAPPSTPVGI